MKTFWKSETQRQPSSSGSDEVSKAAPVDIQILRRPSITDFTLRFYDVLDSSKLKSSVERLLEVGDWGQLTRLRSQDAKSQDNSISQVCGQDRPALVFSHGAYEQNVEDHPHASKLPVVKPMPAVCAPIPSKLRELLRYAGYPETVDEWLNNEDAPCLAVKVVSFNNATLLTISYPSILMDPGRLSTFLKTWTAMLSTPQGDEEIDQLIQNTTAHSLTPPAKENHVLANNLLSPISTFMHSLLDTLDNVLAPRSSTRTIIIPSSLAQRLRQSVRTDFSSLHHHSYLGEKIPFKPSFITDNDLVFAFISRLVLSARGVTVTRPVTLVNVSNAAEVPTYTFLESAEQLMMQPLGVTAKAIRESLTAQRKPSQVQAYARLQEGGGRLVFGDGWDMVEAECENWHKGKFFDLDFSAAVVGQENIEEHEAEETETRGKPSGIYVSGHQPLRNTGSFLGRDTEGNWWISWTLRNDVWPIVEKKLKDMARDKSG